MSKLCLIGTERVNVSHQTIMVPLPYNLCYIIVFLWFSTSKMEHLTWFVSKLCLHAMCGNVAVFCSN